MIIPELWRKLNCLVPDPQCKTFGDEYDLIQWTDARPMPTATEVQNCTEAMVIEAELDKEITDKMNIDKAFKLLFFLNLDQENRIRVLESKPEIDEATYKQALIDRYKAL